MRKSVSEKIGVIVINPDLAQGNDGPQGFAEIRDGRGEWAASLRRCLSA